jgi:2-methylisocitrate lyase-like PEP mutase family enzyme
MSDHIERLRQMLAAEKGVLLPGAPNALAARIIADLGFKAVYLTGAGLTNMFLGVPDLGFMDLSQVTEHTMAMRDVVDLPIIVDADTGFGNAVNVAHTVRMLESAGASAVQLEDQHAPKRCGHFSGKEIVPIEEMVNKIKSAVDARRQNMIVIARTDARAVEGLEQALERAHHYVEAGADVMFVEAPENIDEVREIGRRVNVPQLLNIVVGGRTPQVTPAQASEMGFNLLLYANTALQGAIHGMQTALRTLIETGSMDEQSGLVATFAERQRLVQKPFYDELERRYATK